MQENAQATAPPCDDPEGTPAWQRALGLGSQVNYRRRIERKRTAAAIQDEAIRRGDHDAAVIAGHQAHEAGQAARRDQKLLYRHAVRHQGRAERVPPAELRVRSVRPVARERRESSTRSSAKSGDSGDDGSGSEPPGETAGRPAERGPAPSPRFSRPWRRADGQVAERLAAFSRGEGA